MKKVHILCIAVLSGLVIYLLTGCKTEEMNTVPVAKFNVKPSAGDIDTNFLFDASSSYDDEDTPDMLEFRWDWDNDGIWDSPYALDKTASHQYSSAGKMTTALQVKDSGGKTGTTTREVSVYRDGRPCLGAETVNYEGQSYNTIQIGLQCWFRENLNAGVMLSSAAHDTSSSNGIIEKFCYNDNEENCAVYGGLYQWKELMKYNGEEGSQGICPDGWHVPTNSEWQTMVDYLGGVTVAAGAMKETGTDHWRYPNFGATNSSGFTVLPAGNYWLDYDIEFQLINDKAYFWTSTQQKQYTAKSWEMDYNNDGIHNSFGFKVFGYSVRCLKD